MAEIDVEIVMVLVIMSATAQACRAGGSVCGTGGRWFEPTQLYQINQIFK
jgi:hypothetical protein